ncbi:MAG: efflux RND transporter periplasmic adaptor subunit [Bacillota bacterium]
MKKKWIAACMAVVLLVGGYYGYRIWMRNRAKQTLAAGIKTMTVKKGLLQEVITGSGNMQSVDKSEIRTNVMGYVEEVIVKEGQQVKAGDLLYRLSNSSVVAALKQARLDLVLAQNNLDKVVRQNQGTASALRDAELKVSQQQVNYDQKRNDLANLKIVAGWDGTITNLLVSEGDDVALSTNLLTLYDPTKGTSSDADLKVKLQQARANLDLKQQDLANLKIYADFDGEVSYVDTYLGDTVAASDVLMSIREPNRLQSATDDVKLKIRQAQTNVENKAKDVANLELRAPVTGKVSDLRLNVGDTVGTNTLVGTIGDSRQLRATVNVPQNVITGIVKGARALVTVSATANTYEGHVTDISANWVTQANTVYYPVEITIDNDGDLLAGMSVNVTIESTDTNVGWTSTVKGSLANTTQKDIKPLVSGDVIAVLVRSGDWVTEGQVLAVLKNDSVVLALDQARQDLRKLESTEIKPKVTGRVAQILVAPGSKVKKGDLLVVIQNEAVEAAAKQAQLDLDRLESGDIKPKVTGSVKKIYVTEGQSVKAGTLLMELRNDNVVYLEQKANYDLTAAKTDLASLLGNQGANEVEVAAMKVENEKADLDSKQADFDALTIKAPINGKVYPKMTPKKGDKVPANTLLAVMYDMSGMQLVANIDELDVARIQPGQAAMVTVDALVGRNYKATVNKISEEGVAKDGVATFPVTLDIKEPNLIRPAMTASANIIVASKEDVISVPRDIVKRSGGQMVVTVMENGKQVQRVVQVGIQTQTHAEITQGLSEGDVVVVSSAANMLRVGGGNPVPGGVNQQQRPGTTR